jgi:hypothetical protein
VLTALGLGEIPEVVDPVDAGDDTTGSSGMSIPPKQLTILTQSKADS